MTDKQTNKAREVKSSILDQALNQIDPGTKQKVDNRMYFAAKISEVLEEKGMKKKDLAELMGKKHTSEITKWLSGSHNFTIDTLSEIGSVLGINLLQEQKLERKTMNYFHIVVSQRTEVAPRGTINIEKESFIGELTFEA